MFILDGLLIDKKTFHNKSLFAKHFGGGQGKGWRITDIFGNYYGDGYYFGSGNGTGWTHSSSKTLEEYKCLSYQD